MTVSPVSVKYAAAPEVKYTVARDPKGFTVDFSIPLAVLGRDPKGFTFNVCRERNLVKLPAEYSTLSPPACLGNWHNADCYARITVSK